MRRFGDTFRRPSNVVKGWMNNLFYLRLGWRTIREMSDDDATHMAAGVAYYAVFSLFPLLIGLIAIFNLLPASETRQEQLTEFVAGYLPGSEDLLDRNVRIGGALGVIAIFGLIWSGSAIFGAAAKVVNRAWDVHKDRPIYINKPRQMAMALAVGLMFLTSLGASAFVRIAGEYAKADLPAPDFLVDVGGRLHSPGLCRCAYVGHVPDDVQAAAKYEDLLAIRVAGRAGCHRAVRALQGVLPAVS